MTLRTALIITSATILLLNLVSCGPAMEVRINIPSIEGLETTNLEDIRRSANVGEVMTSSSPLILYPRLTLESEATATTSHRNKQVIVTIQKGTYEFDGSDNSGQFFKSEFPFNVKISDKDKQGFGGLYIPNDNQSKSAIYWQWSVPFVGGVKKEFVAYLKDIPPHKVKKIPTPQSENYGFVSSLTYGGVASGQIKFIYREYNDGLARAAFTQEVSLDYKPGQTYAYKDARFVVHNADSVKVEYTVIDSL